MNNVTDLTSIRASAVPAVPKEIYASQRLAALELAQRCEDGGERIHGLKDSAHPRSLLLDAARLLREIAQ